MWECFKRVIKPRGTIVLTASGKFAYQLVASNFEMFKYEWIWDKVAVTNFAVAKYQPLRSHESILVFYDKGCTYNPQLKKNAPKSFGRKSATKSKAISKNGMGTNYRDGVGYPKTIIKYMRPNNLTGGGLHPTQKPIALFEYLIRTYTQPGEVVFDPVVGSGTTAIAARNTGRDFIVGDSSEEYVKVARQRLALPYTVDMFDGKPTPEDSPEQMTMELSDS